MDRPVTLPDTAPVVIFGGGIIGVSALYHLAKRGVPAVLLERKRLASGTTWRAAGIVGQLHESGAQTELAKCTAQAVAGPDAGTGKTTGRAGQHAGRRCDIGRPGLADRRHGRPGRAAPDAGRDARPAGAGRPRDAGGRAAPTGHAAGRAVPQPRRGTDEG
jgi:hypothetical protein